MLRDQKIIIVDENNNKHIVNVVISLTNYENFNSSNNFSGIVSCDTYRDITRHLPCSNVYIIQEGNGHKYKIGYTKNPPKRLEDLQKGNPERLKYLGFFPGGRNEEQKLQQLCKSNKTDNGGHEWFSFNQQEVNEVLDYFSGKRISPVDHNVILIRNNGECIFASLGDYEKVIWTNSPIKYFIPVNNIDNVLSIIPTPNNYILIQCKGSHKCVIHKSGKDVEKSVKNLQTGNSSKLTIEATSPINVPALVDKQIGKWFDSNDEKVEQIKQVFLQIRRDYFGVELHSQYVHPTFEDSNKKIKHNDVPLCVKSAIEEDPYTSPYDIDHYGDPYM